MLSKAECSQLLEERNDIRTIIIVPTLIKLNIYVCINFDILECELTKAKVLKTVITNNSIEILKIKIENKIMLQVYCCKILKFDKNYKYL